MSGIRWVFATLALVLLAGLPRSGSSQDITMYWEFKVEPQSAAAFEAALKAHMEFREANGDPWEWRFFQQVVGKNLGTYMARAPGHSWADFDAYLGSDFSEVAGKHFDATVLPLVKEAWNGVDQENAELSHLPENMDPYTLFNVSVFYLKPDKMADFSEAVGTYKQLMIDHDFPFYWAVQSQAAGGDGPTMALVGFAESWADMAEDPAVEAAMMETLGEEGAMELFQQFYGSFHHFENWIGQLRPDLSSGGM
ncbi:MAG: hypothetical protein HKO65_17545 [Gemmatimonadetes bacterium]|nr:hypothetical protein [Gemmatimonadota bacterium]